MYDRDRAIRAVNRAQKRQHDRVVPSERDHPWVMLPILRDRHERRARERVVRQGGEWRAVQQLPVSILDLLDRKRVVVRRHGYIAAVDNLEPGQKRIHRQRHVISTVQRQAARSRTYTGGSEACSRPVRCAGVLRRAIPSMLSDCARSVGGGRCVFVAYKGSTEERNVEWDVPLLREALDPRQFRKRCYTGEDRVGSD
jgi:hypothetical protein